MTEDQQRFHLEEYRVARAEIAATVKLIYDVFFGAALASGAISAWLLTNADKVAMLSSVAQHAAWYIPFGVALIASLGFYHFDSIVIKLATYAKKLEGELGAEGLGWEHFQARDYSHSTVWTSRLRFGAGWALVLIADLILAIFAH